MNTVRKNKVIMSVVLSIVYLVCNFLNPEYTTCTSMLLSIALTCECISCITKYKTKEKEARKIKINYTALLISVISISLVTNYKFAVVGKMNSNKILLCISFIVISYLVSSLTKIYKCIEKVKSSHLSIIVNYVGFNVLTVLISSLIIENSYESNNLLLNVKTFNLITNILLVYIVNRNKCINNSTKVLNKFYKFTIYLMYAIITIIWYVLGYFHNTHASLIWHSNAVSNTSVIALISISCLSIAVINSAWINIQKIIHFLVKCDNNKSAFKVNSEL